MTRLLSCVFLVLVLLSATLAAPQTKQSIDDYFSDRQQVESIIACFVNDRPCNKIEQKIKDRAFATMRNFGQCPAPHCKTEEERQSMTRSMELLQSKYPDLWARLIGAMLLGVDVGGR
ncbi:uncharacterized protein [Macrobrachium rosenbergii]|uniref:uncharacterized protein n=1 Tax=Macrobrachium rosenbergii TaxID=79674 RepID=UPI0034D4B9EF